MRGDEARKTGWSQIREGLLCPAKKLGCNGRSHGPPLKAFRQVTDGKGRLRPGGSGGGNEGDPLGGWCRR